MSYCLTRTAFLFALATLSLRAAGPDITAADAAIRAGDLPRLHQLVNSREAANIADGLSATPLHYAAMYGSVDAVRFLLDRGANPNAANLAGETPLILGAWDLARTRLMVQHGGDVNAASNRGVTPLMVAANTHADLALVQYLIAHGAEANARDKDGIDVLMRAASSGDPETIALLLAHGANPKAHDDGGYTALMNAMSFPDALRARILLEAGADPNAFNTDGGSVKNGPLALRHLSALMMAAPGGDPEQIDLLLHAGARVNEKDIRGMTPLMLSVATDHTRPSTVHALIAAGADVQAKDINGEGALDWARRYGNPEILSMLTAAGGTARELAPAPVAPAGSRAASPAESVSRALALFRKSQFFMAGGGCAGCHHQPSYARAYGAANRESLVHDAALRQMFLDAQIAVRPRMMSVMPTLDVTGGDYLTVLAMLEADEALTEPSNQFVDAMVHLVALRQDVSGAWAIYGVARPPITDSVALTTTARAIEALQHYQLPARKAEFHTRIQKASEWLLRAKPETTYEAAERIRGLYFAGVPQKEWRADAMRLISLQQTDGGWTQTPYLPSDAYATGLVLATLLKAGLLMPTDEPYRRGVEFLLRTQFPDGSWYVRSRAPKFQPYFQSGFPFDHDQWISSAGSSWAVMALSPAAAPTAQASR